MFYAGIGSRKCPKDILEKITKYSSILESLGYILRSGGADGCDKAFEMGIKNTKNKQIFYSKDAEPWSYDYVQYCMPNDRKGYFDKGGFLDWDAYVRGLLARNMMQILGEDGKSPVDFVLCWTPIGDYSSSDVGGTGYAIRCALKNKIPVFNLNTNKDKILFETHIKSNFKKQTQRN
jgi:hypothetical protein